MEDSAYLVVACPKCNAKYKIQKSMIPPQGKAGQCKMCHTRFTVHLNSQGVTSTLHQESQGTAVRFCPKCNRKQDYGNVCYLCGSPLKSRMDQNLSTRIVQQGGTVQQNNQPPSFIPTKTGIEITARFFPLMWILFFTHPTFVVDGEKYRSYWRRPFFKSLAPGMHHIKIYFFYFFLPQCGANEMDIEIFSNEICEIHYDFNIPFIFARGDIKLVNVRTSGDSSKSSPNAYRIAPSTSWFRSKTGVIWLLILFFPVGLFLLWDTDHFTLRTKILVTLLIALFLLGRAMS